MVEPGYKTYYPPVALMKISTWHKNKGDEVDFVKDNAPPEYFGYSPPRLKNYYDKIYVTSLFTYHFNEVVKSVKYYQEKFPSAKVKVGGVLATLLPDKIKEETGIYPHVGLLKNAEECSPDYSLFPKLNFSITSTTKGCIRKCKFCVVRLIEPQFFVRDWEKDVNPKSKKIIFWDNNWLASPNFYGDVEKLKRIKKVVDFNQGIDCRLFDEEKAKLLSQLMISPLRFAFDSPAQEEHIQKAIKLARKHGFKDIMVYLLYNAEEDYDTPEYFYHRVNELNKLKVDIYPMRYRPINNIQTHIVAPKWNTELLRGIKLITLFYYSRGIIRRNRKAFIEIFGRNATHFKYKMHKVCKYDRKLQRESKRRHDSLGRSKKHKA